MSSHCKFPLLGLCAALFALGAPRPAWSHPHVWVDYYVDVAGTKEGIAKLNFRWHFDAMFTSMLKEDFGVKSVTPREVQILRDNAFSNLRHYHYYIFAKLDGKNFEPQEISNFGAEMKGKNIEYTFTVSLPHPASKLELSLYDPEFYVDIGPPIAGLSVDSPGAATKGDLKPKPFISVSAEKGASPPTCDVPQSKPRISETWGKFTVYTIMCRAAS
jgi:hypothetical protein